MKKSVFLIFFFLLIFSIPVMSLPVTIHITGGEGCTVNVLNPNSYSLTINISHKRLFGNDAMSSFDFPSFPFSNTTLYMKTPQIPHRPIWLIYIHVTVQEELTRVGLVIRNNIYFVR